MIIYDKFSGHMTQHETFWILKLFKELFALFKCSWYYITGDLLFTLPKKSDTGLYSCEVVNEHGMDMASTKVIIRGKICHLMCYRKFHHYKTTLTDGHFWFIAVSNNIIKILSAVSGGVFNEWEILEGDIKQYTNTYI
jgi:hypothetical protein